MFVSDYKNTIEYAKEEGRMEGKMEGKAEGKMEGMIEGRAEGREMERIAIAKNMLASGMTPEQISELTQIPLEEVKQITA